MSKWNFRSYFQRLLLFVFLFWGGLPAKGQSLFFEKINLSFTSPNEEITNVFQSKNGWVILGTTHGIYQYDGNVTIPMYQSTAGSGISAIFEDQNKGLWIGMENGQILQKKLGQKIKVWQPPEGVPQQKITAIQEDENHNIWLATYGEGLYCWNGKRLFNFNMDDGLPSNQIYCMQAKGQGVWLGTDQGLSYCSFNLDESKTIFHYPLNGAIVLSLCSDKDEALLLGTFEKGIIRFSTANHQYQTVTPNWEGGSVSKIIFKKATEVIYTVDKKRLGKLSYTQKKYQQIILDADFKKQKIQDLLLDNESNLWLAHKHQIQLAPAQFSRLHTSDEQIHAICQTPNGLWLGSENGLSYWENGEEKNMLVGISIISLKEDTSGAVWVGTSSEGLFLIRRKGKDFQLIPFGKYAPHHPILDIAVLGDRIWLATLGGAFEANWSAAIDSLPSFQPIEGIGSNYIYQILLDHENNAWFATDGKGICHQKGEKVICLHKFGTHSFKKVYSICQGEAGEIYFSADHRGLFKMEDGKIEHWGLKEGLRNLHIQGIHRDALGRIFILHAMGIDLYHPSSKTFSYWGHSIDFVENGGRLNLLSYQTNQGIAFVNGKNTLHYQAHENSLQQPKINIDQIELFNQAIDPSHDSIFEYNENNISFGFSGLYYSNPNLITFQYLLENHAEKWTITKDKKVNYFNLPPGKYCFKVQASKNHFIDASEILSYSFVIKKPFWKTAFFLGMMALIGCLFIWYLIRWRERNFAKKLQQENERVRNQLNALKSQVDPHFLFNSLNVLSQVVEENPSNSIPFIEHLSDFYRSCLRLQETELIDLEEELSLIRNYIYLLKQRHEEGFEINIQIPPSAFKKKIIPFSLQLLVENAIKHNIVSTSKPLKISIQLIQNQVVITNNLQLKSTKPVSSHFGLFALQKKYQLILKKKISIQKNQDFFEVRLPIS